MEIVNASRNVCLADRGWRAESLFARMKGLLGRTHLEAGEGLHIVPCNSIHTFFMNFPIDVLFLDREQVILRAFPAMKPWRLTRVYPRAHSVVELPAGTLERTGTYEGDRVQFTA